MCDVAGDQARALAPGHSGDAVGFSGVLAPILTIWSLVGIALLVWYLWALARLFPRIGLPASAGWIPVWNQWRLLDRAGLPGWLAVLVVIPVVAVVPYVCSIIAMHRLNRAAGVGAEYTVLGAFLPPLWATLLAAELSEDAPLKQPLVPQAAPVASPQSAPTYARAGERADASGAAAHPGLPGLPQQQAQPDAVPQPYRSQHSTPPSVAPAFLGEVEAAASASADPAQLPDQPHEPWRELGVGDLPAAPASLRPEADRDRPDGQGRPGSQGPGEWWLGLTTEQEFARLAAEEQRPQQAPLRPTTPLRAFAWPGPEPVRDAEPAPGGTESAPPLHPVAEPAAQAQAPHARVPAEAAPEEAPLRSASSADATPAETTDRSRRFRPPAHRAPVPEPEGSPRGPDAPALEPDELGGLDDDLEQTVVARRPRATGWIIELEDGTTIPLPADDIVIGRKPSADGVPAVAIPDPSRTLSKSHARLRRSGEGWTIEDLDSTNGVALVHEDGREEDVAPRTATVATRRLIIGTMRVVLTREGSAE